MSKFKVRYEIIGNPSTMYLFVTRMNIRNADSKYMNIHGKLTFGISKDSDQNAVNMNVRLTHVNGVKIPNEMYVCNRPSQFLIREGLVAEDFQLVNDV